MELNNDTVDSKLLMNSFINWLLPIVPLEHSRYFEHDADKTLELLNEKYQNSFYHSLFDIDLDNLQKEQKIIIANYHNINKTPDTSFKNYNIYTRGMAKSILLCFVNFISADAFKDSIEQSLSKIEYSKTNFSNEIKKEVCENCGAELPLNSSKLICKSCERKKHAIKILKELLEIHGLKPNDKFQINDLKEIGFNKTKANDYIWTLEENNLVDKDNYSKKYSLKDMDTLQGFIGENSNFGEKIEINKDTTTKDKLYRTCPACKKNLPASNFHKNSEGLSKYCKACTKKMNAIKSLDRILKFSHLNEYFSQDDLKSVYPDKFILNNDIWVLQENDLITSVNTNKFSFNNENINNLLNKYGKYCDSENSLISCYD